jgi:hypothetical protein
MLHSSQLLRGRRRGAWHVRSAAPNKALFRRSDVGSGAHTVGDQFGKYWALLLFPWVIVDSVALADVRRG